MSEKPKSKSPAILAVVVLSIAAVYYFTSNLPSGSNAAAKSGSASGSAAKSAAKSANTESGYILTFAEDFNPLLANRDDLGIAVMLAVDISGSMENKPVSGGKAKYIQAAAALSQVVDALERLVKSSPAEQLVKVGVITFNDKVNVVMPLTVLNAAGIASLRNLAAEPHNFAPGGSTAIGLALARGIEDLSQSGLILRSMIVVTDGENVTGADPAWVLSAVYGSRNSASTADYPVSTNSVLVSFIGFDLATGIFEPLRKYGARITAAANQSELAAALSGLLEADITKLEAPSLGTDK